MEILGKLLFKNTITNYILLAIKMLTAIILTRLIFLGLGEEFYGYWTLLWAIFGYSLLLDFGFGKTVQKYTAEANFTHDIKNYNRIISAVFCSYVVMALIIIAAAIGMTFFIEKIFSLKSGENSWYYRLVFMIFGIGIAAVFPSGIFPEILVGMKKIYLRNYIMLGNIFLELGGIFLIFKLHGSLLSLAIFSATLNLSTNIIMAIVVFRIIPGLKISLRGFDKSTLRQIADFSIFAYIITMANLLIFKTDRIVLGVMVGMEGVAIYQLGTRIPEIMQFLTTQFQENLSPLAASLHKTGDHTQLEAIMLSSNRLTVFLSTCVLIVFTMLSRQIMFVWLNVLQEQVIYTVYIMMASVYIMVAFRSTANHYLLMTGKHRLVATLTVIESIVNLLLSIVLIHTMGVIGVAVGTLIPNAIIGIFIVFPLTAIYCKQSVFKYIIKVYLPAFFIGIPSMAFLYLITSHIPLNNWDLFKLSWAGPVAGFIYLIIGWTLFVSKEEKTQLISLLPAATPAFIRKALF
ncbi:MAG: oligosaccharide flippase family protein [Victivallaceae bacterium]